MQDFRVYINDDLYELCKAIKDHKCERCKRKIKAASFYIFREARYIRERFHVGCGIKKLETTIRYLRDNIKDLTQMRNEFLKLK
jgi:hypothetical protein